MSEWAECTFCDLFAEDTKNGVFKSNGVPNIEANLIGMGALFHNDFIREYNEDKLSLTSDEVERFGVRSGDLLFGRRSLVESGAGKASLVVSASKPTVFESSIIRVRLDTKKADPRFYAYYFRTGVGRGRVFAIVNGAAVKGIRSSDLQKIRVHLPPLPIQRRIADILSAYDDLIENNRRRIEILEETARTLYKKMFGNDGTNGTCGTNGTRVRDFFDISIGRTPPRKNEECFSRMASDQRWASIKDMRDEGMFLINTAERLTRVGVSKSKVHISPRGTVVLSFKLTVGLVAILAEPMATNEAIAHFETTDKAVRDYTYFYLKSFEYSTLGSTSAIATAINSEIVRNMPFVMPDRDDLESFEVKVGPMVDQIENLSRQNAKLAAARDLLLPRLMSGKMSVFAAEPLRRDEEVA